MSPAQLDAVKGDITALNIALLDTVTGTEEAMWVRQRWRIADRTRSLLLHAGAEVRGRIAAGGAPLFRLRIADVPHKSAVAIPSSVVELQESALLSAQRAWLLDPYVAGALYRTAAESLRRLSTWPLDRIRQAAREDPHIVRVRAAETTAYWAQLIKCGKAGGAVSSYLVGNLLQIGTD